MSRTFTKEKKENIKHVNLKKKEDTDIFEEVNNVLLRYDEENEQLINKNEDLEYKYEALEKIVKLRIDERNSYKNDLERTKDELECHKREIKLLNQQLKNKNPRVHDQLTDFKQKLDIRREQHRINNRQKAELFYNELSKKFC